MFSDLASVSEAQVCAESMSKRIAPTGAKGNWRRIDLREADSRDAARVQLETAASGLRFGAMAYDIDWKAGPQADWSSLTVLERGQSAISLLVQQDRPLDLHMGERCWLSLGLARHTTVGEPMLAGAGDGSGSVSEFLYALAAELPRGDAVFFEGLPIDGFSYQAIQSDRRWRRKYLALQLGDPFDHLFAELPESFDAYLKTLSTRSRQSVLYSERKLAKDMEQRVELRCYQTAADIESFLSLGSAISRKTYQWNLLGLGLRADEDMRSTLALAAERGWFRSYLLFCRDEPVAFMLGYQRDACYYYTDVGYDPSFSEWSVGSVLQIKVMRHLYEDGARERPTAFDFSTGYGAHKARFGNVSRREVNLLLLPNTVRGKYLWLMFRLNEKIVALLTEIIDRFGLKAWLKKMLRTRATTT
ncbi:MAG: GNAT family N-acetyltransferase [Burkholderiaceae bacterium]